MNRTKQGLLAAAARKPVHKFLQMDGFMNVEGDCVMHPDADGDTVFFGETDELRNLRDIVRFSIPWDADADAVRRIVGKMAAMVDSALRVRDEGRGLLLSPAVREELLDALQRIGDVTEIEVTGMQDEWEGGATTVTAVLHGRTETAPGARAGDAPAIGGRDRVQRLPRRRSDTREARRYRKGSAARLSAGSARQVVQRRARR